MNSKKYLQVFMNSATFISEFQKSTISNNLQTKNSTLSQYYRVSEYKRFSKRVPQLPIGFLENFHTFLLDCLE